MSRLTPSSGRPAGLRRMVVGVDGSDASLRATEWAAAVAAQMGAEVVVVHALGLLAHLGTTVEPAQSHQKEIRALLEGEWSRPLIDLAVEHRCELMNGNPVTALLEAARRHDVDAVVVGRRGAGGFPGLQIGSTSQQLAQHAQGPIVVIPPEEG